MARVLLSTSIPENDGYLCIVKNILFQPIQEFTFWMKVMRFFL